MLGSMQWGYIYIFPSPTSAEIHERFHMDLNDLRWSLYSTSVNIGAFIVTFFLPRIIRLFKNSRKKLTAAVYIHFIIFLCLNMLLVRNIWAGFVARFFLGFGIGIFSYLTPMYLVEIAPPEHSGSFGTFQELGIMIGQLLLFFVGGVLGVVYLSCVFVAHVVIALCLLWFVPESPVLTDNDLSNSQLEEKHVSIFQRKYLKSVCIAAFAVFSQQFCGINAITNNLSDILSASGLDINPSFQAGIGTCAQFISVVLSSFFVDKFGIKIMWTVSYTLMAASLLVFSLNERFYFANWAPMVILFIFQLTYGLGAGPIPWYVARDIYQICETTGFNH